MDENHEANRYCNSLLQNANNKEITLDKAIVFYTYTRCPGHEFALLTNLLYVYDNFKLNNYDIVVTRTVKDLGNSIYSILDTLIGKDKIHYVDNCAKVFIKNSIIYNADPNRNSNYASHLFNRLQSFRLKTNKHDKICFIKTNKSKNLYTNSRSFDESYIEYFSSKGYTVIEPSDYNVIDLFNLIQDAKNVILTWGSNSWVNSSYCSDENNVMILCHIGYEHEYISNHPCWTPVSCNRLVKVTGLTSDPINNDVRELFDKNLIELEGIIE